MDYTLVRTLPNGAERTQTGLKSRREAARAAADVIMYNCGTISRRDYNAFAARVHDARLGETVTHDPSGYRFRVEPAD